MQDHPDRVGPYLVISRLGRGGTGVVYAATHEETGQRVALKVVHLARSHHSWLRREIAALSRLEHRQIVRVLDHGEVAGTPWFAMELVEGPPLSTFAETHFGSQDASQNSSLPTYLPDGPEHDPWKLDPEVRVEAAGGRLTDALELIRQLCAPLAFLHGEGLVHRDLKPDNVLLRDRTLPVLVDFGLASAFAARGRESLDLAGLRAGTPPYMAPEQVRAAPLDARADLYALGCILYELLTGRPPFVGLRGAVLRSHLAEEPEPPSTHVAGVPPALDALCLALLEKDPAHRIGYAADVARELSALLGTTPPAVPGPAPRPYLYRPGLTGREDVVDRAFEALREGPGMVLLTGESGLGKTRVAEFLARRWAQSGRTVITATSTPEDPALSPWRAVLHALARRLERADRDELEAALALHGPVLARFEPALLPLVDDRTMDQPPLPPKAEHLRVLRAMTHALEWLARRRSPLLVLDDLHQADPLSLDVLGWAVRHGLPLRILATARPEGLPAELASLGESAQILALELAPLDPSQSGRMAARMLAVEAVAEPLQRWVHGLSEGRPYAVSEALRLALSDGLLTPRASGGWSLDDDAGSLPNTIEELVARRLDAVPAEARPVLEAAAVLGRDLTAATLGAVLERAEEDTVQAAASLLALDILELRPSGALGWAHDRLWQTARDRLPEDRRASLHHAAAAALEASGQLGAAAHHLEEADARWPAAAAHARAARVALDQSALAEADRRFAAAIDLIRPGDGVEGLRIVLDHATRVLTPRGDNATARDRLEDALPKARALGDDRLVARCLDGLARIHGLSSEPTRQLELAERAVAAWERVGDQVGLARARRNVAIALDDLGRRDEALETFEGTLALLQELDEPLVEAECRANLGLHAIGDGRLELAVEHYEAARTIAESHGARALLGRILTNLASLSWRSGDLDTAIARLLESLAIHRSMGARDSEAITLANLAVGYREQGRYAEAVQGFTEALAIDREVLNRRSEAWNLSELSKAELLLGKVGEARAHAVASVLVAREVAEPYVTAHVLLNRVRLERRLEGRVHTAELDELVAAAEAAGRHGMVVRVLGEQGHQALAAGEDATPWLEAVKARAAERSEDTESVEALAQLEAAVRADTEGRTIRGEAPETLPASLRP